MDPYSPLYQQARIEIKRRRRIFRTIAFLSLLYFAITFTFGNSGLIKYLELRGKKSHLAREIRDLDAQNTRLKSEVKLLKENPFYMEKHAREDLGMAIPGEIIFKYDQ